MSNLKKCLADPTLQVPLDEIQVDAKLNFVEEHVEILGREFKKLKRSRIAIVKVKLTIVKFSGGLRFKIEWTPAWAYDCNNWRLCVVFLDGTSLKIIMLHSRVSAYDGV
ncbi:hypothetical protein Tco_0735927 [Tanacetum coccineum]